MVSLRLALYLSPYKSAMTEIPIGATVSFEVAIRPADSKVGWDCQITLTQSDDYPSVPYEPIWCSNTESLEKHLRENGINPNDAVWIPIIEEEVE